MSCKISFEKLAMHMARAENSCPSRLASHVATCPDCTAKMNALSETTRLLDGAGLVAPPTHMWGRISDRLTPRTAARRRTPMRALATAVLVLLIALVTVFPIRPRPANGDDLAELYQFHTAAKPASAASQVSAAAVRDFEKREGLSVQRPSSLPSGWKLIGLEERLCRRGLPVAHMVYARKGKVVSVFEKPGVGQGRGNGPGAGCGFGRGHGRGECGRCRLCDIKGTNVVVVSARNVRYVVMGDLPPTSLDRIAHEIAAGQ